MSYQIFNEASLGKFIELIQNKVRSIVDNATVASARSATNATNDADGNAIKTTYRKVADSYTKAEVDTAVNGKVSKSGDTITGKLTAPKIETGTGDVNYLQSRKFRGEGDADTYSHAIDFGYANHDMVDFHEHGGVWNFYQNTEGKSNTGSLVASIQPDGVHAPLKGNADTATSATMATQDSDGNAINTTYRKISDSYSKTEVDNKVANSSKSMTITTDDLINNYNCSELLHLLEGGTTIYLQLTHSDPVYFNDDKTLSIYEYGKTQYGNYLIVWGSLLDYDGKLVSFTVTASEPNIVGTISLSYMITETNTLTTVSTISIAASAWNSTSKTATVSVSGVEEDNAVDVAPAESSFDDYVNAGIRATAQSDGKLTFTCKTIPTKAISVNVKAISTGPLRNENRTKK